MLTFMSVYNVNHPRFVAFCSVYTGTGDGFAVPREEDIGGGINPCNVSVYSSIQQEIPEWPQIPARADRIRVDNHDVVMLKLILCEILTNLVSYPSILFISGFKFGNRN